MSFTFIKTNNTLTTQKICLIVESLLILALVSTSPWSYQMVFNVIFIPHTIKYGLPP